LLAWGGVLAVASAVGIPKATAAQHLVDGARPLVAPTYLDREQALVAEGKAGIGQLVTTGLPRLAARLGESPSELQADVASRYPDVAMGVTRLPAILATTSAALGNLQRHHSDFEEADSFPAPGVSRLGLSVGGIVFGAALVLLGIVALRSVARWPLAAALLLTLAAAGCSVGFSLPHKAASAEAVANSLNLTQKTADDTRHSLEVVEGFHDQLAQQLIPDAAARLRVSSEALTAELEDGLDSLQASQRHYATTITTFTPDLELRQAAIEDFQSVKDVPVVTVTWVFMVGCALIAIAAAGALAVRGPRGERTG